jgi:hypothetical protein
MSGTQQYLRAQIVQRVKDIDVHAAIVRQTLSAARRVDVRDNRLGEVEVRNAELQRGLLRVWGGVDGVRWLVVRGWMKRFDECGWMKRFDECG